MKKCGVCGTNLNDDAVFCTECGRKVCKNCGNPIGSAVTQCPKCGELTVSGAWGSLLKNLTIAGGSLIVLGLLVSMFVQC